jgi:hypothetical protein
MKCPNCNTRITTKDYDVIYEWYECPKCEGCFTADEIEEAASGTSPGKRSRSVSHSGKKAGRGNSVGNSTAVDSDIAADLARIKPIAKGKKRLTEIAEDDEAIAKHETEMLKPVKAEKDTKHRDEVATGQILNILADEIEAIGEETGVQITRVNAREFYAMNLLRDLKYKHGVHARDKEVPHVYCKEHS